MNTIRQVGRVIAYLLILYTIGTALGIIMRVLVWRGKIKITGKEHLFGHAGGTLVASNHPSLMETVLLPLLYFPQFLRRPFRAFPWNTPDRNNLSSRWYFRMFTPMRMIMIDRESKTPGANMRAVRKIIDVLWNKGSVILFPEGGRTWKRPEKLVSPKGNELGKLSRSVEAILRLGRSTVIPVWVSGCDRALPPGKMIPHFNGVTVVIRIGAPIHKKIDSHELEQVLLALADEA